jgi:import receptor subunit TOM70
MCISVALKYNPKYVKALVRRAKIADALEDYELAVRDLTAACLVEGFSNAATIENADSVLKKLGQRKAKEMFKV